MVANFDYLISSKNTLSGRYFFTNNPQDLTLGGELPGAPSLLGFLQHGRGSQADYAGDQYHRQ